MGDAFLLRSVAKQQHVHRVGGRGGGDGRPRHAALAARLLRRRQGGQMHAAYGTATVPTGPYFFFYVL